MIRPLPNGPDISTLSRRVSSYSERVDADLARFHADWRRARARFAICAVTGAILVVGFGVWGFRIETNFSKAPLPHAAGATQHPRPQASAPSVMMVINPRDMR